MNRLLYISILTLIFFIPVTAQGQLTTDQLIQKNIDENGLSGQTNTGYSDYTPLSINWNSLPNATEPFGRSIGGKIGDFIYIFGGQANSSMAIAYQISANSWMASTVPTAPAYNPSFCVANDELYKLAGTGAVSVFEKFTPDGSGTGTWTVLNSGPSGVMNSQSTMAWDGSDNIYVHSSSYTAPVVSYLARYSISGNSWTNLTPTTLIKRYAGLQFYNGYLYLIGGLVPTGDDPTACAKYDPSGDTWSAIASIPDTVNFCKWSTTQVPDYIVLVGSGGGYSTWPTNPGIFYYDPASDIWTYDSDTPAERGLALGFFLRGVNKLFFGGGNMGGSSQNYQSDCWDGEASFIPVELVSFTADANGAEVNLSWITATETNNKGFEIQRSRSSVTKNKFSWENIGFVPGSGTAAEKTAYRFTDNNVTNGIYSYRLKQIDFDGTFLYSNVVEANVSIARTFSLEQNYPNPFNPSTLIEYSVPADGFVKLAVFNSLGEQVAVPVSGNMKSGNYSVTFDGKDLPSGVYFYRLETGSRSLVKKMTLMK